MTHIHFFVENVDKFKFCNDDFYEITGTQFIPPSETQPTTGDKHDYKKCKNCLESAIKLKLSLQEKYDKFPNCCKYHANLKSKSFFSKSYFKDIHIHTAHKVIFTQQHIMNNIDKEDWEEEIHNYIEYTLKSFGQIPKDCGEPLFISTYIDNVKYTLNYLKNIPKHKKEKIIEMLDIGYNVSSQSDFRTLLEIYEKWLNIFPFELHTFKNLKEKFSQSIPIIEKSKGYNPYLKLHKTKLRTKTDLVKFLIGGTKALLKELTNKSNREDQIAHELKIISAKHRIKQVKLLENFSKDEKKYLKTINKWLSNEKDYMEEIKTIMKNSNSMDEEDIIIEKLNFLRKELILAYDASKRFSVEKEIKELEQKLEKIKKGKS